MVWDRIVKHKFPIKSYQIVGYGGTTQTKVFLTKHLVHVLMSISRKYTIINANLELINSKIHSFYRIDIHLRFCHVHLKLLHRK